MGNQGLFVFAYGLDLFHQHKKHESMKLYIKAFLITLSVGLILSGLFWYWNKKTVGQVPTKIVQLGQMETEGLPNFELSNLEGKSYQLKDFAGKVVIVSFWATWCAPCLEEFPSMIKLVEELKGDVVLLAVSEDSAKEEIEVFLKAFPKSKNPNIHILWDSDHRVAQMYNADRLPESFVAGKDLKLARKIVGSIDWATPEAIKFMQELVKK